MKVKKNFPRYARTNQPPLCTAFSSGHTGLKLLPIWSCVTRNKGALMVTITYPHHGHVLQFHCHGDSVQAQLHKFHCYLQLWNWILLPAQWIHELGCTQWDTVWGWCVCRWVSGHVSACVRYTCICFLCVCVCVCIYAWVWVCGCEFVCGRMNLCVCMCVCACMRERERGRERACVCVVKISHNLKSQPTYRSPVTTYLQKPYLQKYEKHPLR